MKKKSVFLVTVIACLEFGVTSLAQGNTVIFLDDFAGDDTNGRFVMEAENYSGRTLGTSGGWWEVDGSKNRFIEGPDAGQIAPTAPVGARDNYMEALGSAPTDIPPINGSYDGPFIDYKLRIEATGTYNLYMRWTGHDYGSDSLYAFILKPDDTLLTGAGPNYFLYHGTSQGWNWYRRGIKDSTYCAYVGYPDNAVWTISETGDYTIRVAQRENTTAFDVLVFQMTNLSAPMGLGPAQSQFIPEPTTLLLLGFGGLALLRKRRR